MNNIIRDRFSQRWIDAGFRLAIEASRMSKDPKGQVGAVIMDDRKRVVSSGFNGLPSGVEYEDFMAPITGDFPRADRLACTIHAEENALAFAWQDVAGMTLFCTRQCCAKCAAMIAQRGITCVAVLMDPNDTINPDWQHSFDLADVMFKKRGIELSKFIPLQGQALGITFRDW